jgi:hypothetical protein
MCDWKHWLTLGENAAFSLSNHDEKAAISTGDSEEKVANSWDYYDEEYCLRKLGLINRERDDIGF